MSFSLPPLVAPTDDNNANFSVFKAAYEQPPDHFSGLQSLKKSRLSSGASSQAKETNFFGEFVPRHVPSDPAFRFKRTSLIFDTNHILVPTVCRALGDYLATRPEIEVLGTEANRGTVSLAVFVDGIVFIDVKIRLWSAGNSTLAVEVDLRDGDPMAFVTFYHDLQKSILRTKQIMDGETLSEWNPPLLVSESAPSEADWRALLSSDPSESWIGIACDIPSDQLRALAHLLSRARNVFGQSRSLFGLGKLVSHMAESESNLPFCLKLAAEQLVPKLKQLLGPQTGAEAEEGRPHVWFSVILSLLSALREVVRKTTTTIGTIPDETAAQLRLAPSVPQVTNDLQKQKRSQAAEFIGEINRLLG